MRGLFIKGLVIFFALICFFSVATASPSSSVFSGTLFDSHPDPENATNITITSSDGMINFTNTRFNLSQIGNIDNFVRIESGIVGINSTNLTMFDVPAKITMTGLSFSLTPRIIINDQLDGSGTNQTCPSTICSNVNYDSGTLTFDVTGFSSYTAEEPSGGISLDTPDTVTVGDDNQEASNPDAEEEVNKNIFETESFTVKNTGNQILSDFEVTNMLYQSGFTQSSLNLTFEYPSSLDPGEEASITVKSRIPENLDAANDTEYKPSSMKVAELTIQATAENGTKVEDTTDLLLRRENQLDIEDLDVCVNDKCLNVDNTGDSIENARPGDTITIDIKVENEFSDNDAEDIIIEDITVGYIIDEDDIEEDDDETISEISAGSDSEETFSFTLDDDVDENTYEVLVYAGGIDQHGAYHADEIKFKLVVEKKKRDLEIRDVNLNPMTLSCNRYSSRLNVRFVNLGTRTEDQAAVEYEIKDLDMSQKKGTYQVTEGSEKNVDFEINLPEDVKPGPYKVTVTTYFEQSYPSDQEYVELTVPDCGEEEEEQDDQANETTPVAQPSGDQDREVRVTTTAPKKDLATTLSNGGIIWIIGAVVLLLLVLLVVIVIKLL